MTKPQPSFVCPDCDRRKNGSVLSHMLTVHGMVVLAHAPAGVYVGRPRGDGTTHRVHFLRYSEYPQLQPLDTNSRAG